MYQIAIPTHLRSSTIAHHTLKVLAGVDAPVTLFCSNDVDAQRYRQYERDSVSIVVTNTNDATGKFNAIQQWYAAGTFVFVLEDDIQRVQSLYTQSVRSILNQMYAFCRKHNIAACGIYPSSNKYFMRKSIDVGMTYLVANMFGFTASSDARLLCTLPTKTDYERSVRYAQVYGKVARFNYVSCLTNNYKNAGGMQELNNRAQLEADASYALVDMYPKVFSINNNRKSQYTEVNMSKRIKSIALT